MNNCEVVWGVNNLWRYCGKNNGNCGNYKYNCDSMEAANGAKEVMKLQWSSLIMPGKEVTVKWCQVKVNGVRLHGFNCTREFQLRDLIL